MGCEFHNVWCVQAPALRAGACSPFVSSCDLGWTAGLHLLTSVAKRAHPRSRNRTDICLQGHLGPQTWAIKLTFLVVLCVYLFACVGSILDLLMFCVFVRVFLRWGELSSQVYMCFIDIYKALTPSGRKATTEASEVNVQLKLEKNKQPFFLRVVRWGRGGTSVQPSLIYTLN